MTFLKQKLSENYIFRNQVNKWFKVRHSHYSNSPWNSDVAAQNKLNVSRVTNSKFKIALNSSRNIEEKPFFSMRILYLFSLSNGAKKVFGINRTFKSPF